MPAAARKPPSEAKVAELGQIASQPARSKFLAKHKAFLHPEVVEQLAQLVVQKVRVNPKEAFRLAEAAIAIAKRLRRKESLALSLRAKANALYASGDNRAAIEHHQRAYQIYESLEVWNEAGRTLSSSIQPMILLGEYNQAFQAAEKAREIFTRLNDRWRLAHRSFRDRKSTRLNSSHANISYAVFCLKKKRLGRHPASHVHPLGRAARLQGEFSGGVRGRGRRHQVCDHPGQGPQRLWLGHDRERRASD